MLAFVAAALWQVFYREIVELSPKHFVVRKKLWRIGPTHRYDLDKIRNFRYNPTTLRGYSPGRILFDHDLDLGVSWGFARPVSKVEAVNLIKAIEAYQAANQTSSKKTTTS